MTLFWLVDQNALRTHDHVAKRSAMRVYYPATNDAFGITDVLPRFKYGNRRRPFGGID
jgi:hypothetical protein